MMLKKYVPFAVPFVYTVMLVYREPLPWGSSGAMSSYLFMQTMAVLRFTRREYRKKKPMKQMRDSSRRLDVHHGTETYIQTECQLFV